MLTDMQSSLPPSERKIAEYILSSPHEAIHCTAHELGERSGTSSAAVIRLCKSLGLKGFQELKIRIAGDLQRPMEERYRDIEPQEPHSTVLTKMTANSIQAIRETAQLMNMDELSSAVDALTNAKSVHFFGVGASHIIAKDAQQKFLRINKHAYAFSDVHVAAMMVANISPGDVVMGISHGGETKEVIEVLDLANYRGAKTISITKYGSSSVSDRAQMKLFTSASTEAMFRSGATSSRIAQLHIIDVLFMCVATQKYEETIQHLDQTREAVQSHRVEQRK